MKKSFLLQMGLMVLFASCLCSWNWLSAQNTGDLLVNNIRYVPVSQVSVATTPVIAAEKIKLDYVIDFENIYSDNELQFLKSLVMDYEKTTSVQISIITFDPAMMLNDGDSSVVSRFPDQAIERRDTDSEVILVKICVDRCLMQIEDIKKTGQRITARQYKRIINSSFIPFFQKRKFFEGSLKGLNELMKQIASNQSNKD